MPSSGHCVPRQTVHARFRVRLVNGVTGDAHLQRIRRLARFPFGDVCNDACGARADVFHIVPVSLANQERTILCDNEVGIRLECVAAENQPEKLG